MPALAIRNLTVHPIKLTRVERVPNRRRGLLGNVSGLLHAKTRHKAKAVAAEVAVSVAPFESRQTDVAAPDPGAEVFLLAFRSGGHRYETDVPGAGSRSTAVARPDGGPLELTAVYVAPVLAVFSSARLDAWMRELHDDWPLPLLSIPGTHNSPTCHKALPSVRCQAVGVPDHLRNGVRFLDVRVSAKPDNDALTLVHSAFPIALSGSKYFADLLDDVYRFLDTNPSETVLLSVKREGTGKGSDGQLGKYLKHAYADRHRDRWWTEPAIPTLGQARGKIVIIRRFILNDDMRASCWDCRGWAIDAQKWPDNCEDGSGGDGRFRIQDFYISRSRYIDRKIDFSRGLLEHAAGQVFALAGMPDHSPDTPTPPFFVNFLTASNFFNASCWPEKIAARVNPAVVDYLCTAHGEEGRGPRKFKVGSAGTGIVVIDWVGADGDWDLVRCIVGMNARLQHRQAKYRSSPYSWRDPRWIGAIWYIL